MKIKLYEEFNTDLNLIDYIENNSSFVLNNEKDSETLIFTTRANGDTGSEQYSEIDIQEARELIKILKGKFKDYDYEIETVDEWVDINATKVGFYDGYEPEEDKVGYILSYEKSDGSSFSYKTTDKFNSYSGRDKHRSELKKLSRRFIKEKTPSEVVEIADSLPINRPNSSSEKVLIQKAHNNPEWDTIPNADFYVSRREI